MSKQKLSQVEATNKIATLPDWDIGVEARAMHLEAGFKDFKTALAFVNKVAELAEKANHHPDINFGWGYVDLTLSTHSADGLTDKDFDLAAQISKILK